MIIKSLLNLTLQLSIIFIGLNNEAKACLFYDEYLHSNTKDLIEETGSIVFAKVIRAEIIEDEKVYYFKVEEYLKGNHELYFEMSTPVKDSRSVFSVATGNHNNVYFWTHSYGSQALASDCKMKLDFGIGRKYLIFKSEKNHMKGFEEIVHGSNKWLSFVKSHLANKEFDSSIFEVKEFLGQFDSIHQYQCLDREGIRSTGKTVELVRTYRGVIPNTIRYPKFANERCVGTGLKFIYMHKSGFPPMLVPIHEGFANLDEIANGVMLIPDNLLDMAKITELTK